MIEQLQSNSSMSDLDFHKHIYYTSILLLLIYRSQTMLNFSSANVMHDTCIPHFKLTGYTNQHTNKRPSTNTARRETNTTRWLSKFDKALDTKTHTHAHARTHIVHRSRGLLCHVALHLLRRECERNAWPERGEGGSNCNF